MWTTKASASTWMLLYIVQQVNNKVGHFFEIIGHFYKILRRLKLFKIVMNLLIFSHGLSGHTWNLSPFSFCLFTVMYGYHQIINITFRSVVLINDLFFTDWKFTGVAILYTAERWQQNCQEIEKCITICFDFVSASHCYRDEDIYQGKMFPCYPYIQQHFRSVFAQRCFVKLTWFLQRRFTEKSACFLWLVHINSFLLAKRNIWTIQTEVLQCFYTTRLLDQFVLITTCKWMTS